MLLEDEVWPDIAFNEQARVTMGGLKLGDNGWGTVVKHSNVERYYLENFGNNTKLRAKCLDLWAFPLSQLICYPVSQRSPSLPQVGRCHPHANSILLESIRYLIETTRPNHS